MKLFNILSMSLVTAVFIFIFGLSCAEKEITSDQLQRRAELYYAVNEEEPYSGKVVESYESGQKRIERHYRKGKLHGLSTTWNSNGPILSGIVFSFRGLERFLSSGSRDFLFCELHFWVLPKRNCGLRGDFPWGRV